MELRKGTWTWMGELDEAGTKFVLEATHDCGARFMSWVTTEEAQNGDEVMDRIMTAVKERHKDCVYDRVTEVR